MSDEFSHAPREFPPVMVSSTFRDLKDHREAAIKAINKHKLHPHVMEHDDAKLVDVLKSSLQMVQESAGYLLVIGRKYGQVPECATLNPECLSVTELEFNEALKLGLPILLFIMGDDHLLKIADIEPDAAKKLKLDAFRERAKLMSGTSKLHRVYATFNRIPEFAEQLGSSLAELRDELVKHPADDSPSTTLPSTIPKPPAFYAEPDYIGSHQFVGRQAELDAISDWANRSDPTNLLLFEAIGGNGKSMLTWEWTTKHAPNVRPDWAGRFWYSFYERGAIMQDFCQRALAYMTGRPLKVFEMRKTAELNDELIAQLHARPWLLILDGLERVLVAYHRIDAAEVPDEEASAPTDKILNRNPCDAIRDEDGDLLRALAACAPSKILVSSRLTPRVLLNSAGQPIPGAKRIILPGIRPPDAEALLRQCGIAGDSDAIQNYLQQNCDNHPLLIGILAGLVANYLPDRGNFDAWSVDSKGGAALDLAKLVLIQRRNHILHAAIAALPDASRQLLSTLALLSESVDYQALKALNPHLPPEPEEADEPIDPKHDWVFRDGKIVKWEQMNAAERAETRELYQEELTRRKQYEEALHSWRQSSDLRDAPAKLADTIRDLEQRGLLQYDGRDRRYDLHPVVRGVVAGGMAAEQKELLGERVLDYFSAQPHRPYAQATSLRDLASGLQIVRVLLNLGRHEEAAEVFGDELANALQFNLEAHQEILSVLRPLFPMGWGTIPKRIYQPIGGYLANTVAHSLLSCGEPKGAERCFTAALGAFLNEKDWRNSLTQIGNVSVCFADQNLLAKAFRGHSLALELASVGNNEGHLFGGRLQLYCDQSTLGLWEGAAETWRLLQAMGRAWPRGIYRQGIAEEWFARTRFWQGKLTEQDLNVACRLAEHDNNAVTIRCLLKLCGAWRMAQGEWSLAAKSYQEAIRMARERRLVDAESETGLALAKFHLGQFAGDDARSEAERLANLASGRTLAMLWLAIGDHEHAKKHALAAYKWAWADGEPYVNRYELTKTTELLQQVNVPVPDLPPYDPAKDEPFPWEADVRAAIEKLKAEKAVKKKGG